MTKRIGMIRKKMLTRERIMLIVEYLTRPEKQRGWTDTVRERWERFNEHYEENIERIYNQLRYQVWVPGDFNVFKKREGKKVRTIYESMPEDLIVDTIFFDCLNYVFFERKKIIPETSYGSIKGKGQHDLRAKIISLVKYNKGLYAACWDTEKYYPTMDHDIIMQTLSSHIKDKWMLWFSSVCVSRMGNVGVALGLPSSNPMGHIYHAIIDWMIILQYKIRRFYRFCDDKWAFHKDVNYLHTISRVVIEKTKDVLHQEIKHNWRVLRCKEERFECLGAMINSHSARLKSFSRRRIEKNIKANIKLHDPMHALRSWSGIRGSLKNLSVSNLINYWKEVYPEFFHLLRWAHSILESNRQRRRWHKKLEKILINAKDMRSETNKKLYVYGFDFEQEGKAA